jgi:hypothetical protein
VPEQFRDAPGFGKVAVNGAWEQAVSFRPGEFLGSEEILAFLSGGEEVACEAFFGAAFVGVRRTGPPEELARFVADFARLVAWASTGADFFRALEVDLEVPLARDFQYSEVGAEGAWNSVGPFRIDDPVAALADFEAMWQKLADSAVGQDHEHDKALEFSYANGDGSTHWIALPVSHHSKQLDRGMVAAALAR